MTCYNFSIKIFNLLEEIMTTQNLENGFFLNTNPYANSYNSENVKKAYEFQKRQEKELKIKKIKKFIKRFSVSIFIPLLITLLISVIFTFVIKTEDNMSFSKNFIYFFSKIFFVSIPAMMWFIYRR